MGGEAAPVGWSYIVALGACQVQSWTPGMWACICGLGYVGLGGARSGFALGLGLRSVSALGAGGLISGVGLPVVCSLGAGSMVGVAFLALAPPLAPLFGFRFCVPVVSVFPVRARSRSALDLEAAPTLADLRLWPAPEAPYRAWAEGAGHEWMLFCPERFWRRGNRRHVLRPERLWRRRNELHRPLALVRAC